MINSSLNNDNCIISSIITYVRSSIVDPFIKFVDPIVKQICTTNWGDGVELTYEQAAAVTDLNGVFDYWSANPPAQQIISFNELQYFTGLTNLGELPNDDGQFSGAEQLAEIILPPNLINLGGCTFDGCFVLASIIIPNSVTSIGNGAFYDCTGLTSITVEAITPPTLGTDAFLNDTNLTHIYVPSASVSAYQAATNWSSYASIISAILN